MWHLQITFQVLSFSFLEYVKLAKLAMVQIINIVENERYFSTLALLNQSFGIDSLFTYYLLCACLHNNYILCRISHI